MIRWSLGNFARRVAGTRPYSLPGQFPRSLLRAYSYSPDTARSTPPIKYRYIPEVETIEDYRPGGYHPIHINDSLQRDRYHIVHKLGHGSFSTAWLALDQQTSTYVAVKVGTADADKHEADILCRLTTAPLDKPLIPTVIDQFNIDGPNGTHPCLVITPARCSLIDAKEESESRLFQLDVARSLAAQLVTAISHVHSCSYAHGDLHLGNLLLRLPASLNSLTVEQFYTQDDITAQQVHLQGPLPLEWWNKWNERPKWFDAAGEPLSRERDIWSWERRFDQWIQEPRQSLGMDCIGEEEKAAFLELLQRMLPWKPADRPTAQQVLDSIWIRDWALPAYKKGREAVGEVD